MNSDVDVGADEIPKQFEDESLNGDDEDLQKVLEYGEAETAAGIYLIEF